MIIIEIIFLILFAFLNVCKLGAITGISKELTRLNKRQDEIIRILKK